MSRQKRNNVNLDRKVNRAVLMLKRNKASEAKVDNLVKFSRSLSKEQLLIFMVKFMVGVSSNIHRKKVSQLLEDCDFDQTLLTEFKPIFEDLCNDGSGLKLKDILNEVG